jgi:tRNA (cmo5U34)-methyltransferase
MGKDQIYASDTASSEPFQFNAAVAQVFPDMLRRSIPGYLETLDVIGSLASRYVTPGSNCYDLGCSLGAATLAMRQGMTHSDCRIFAIDNAPAMIERFNELLKTDKSPIPVETIAGDVLDTPIENASMVVMNYTLQFLPAASRAAMLQKICDGMLPGGILVLSEKVSDTDPIVEDLLIDLHHEHKRRNQYSALEVSRKRAALENVLIPESLETHRQRILSAGFSHFGVWQRHFNFLSIIAIK